MRSEAAHAVGADEDFLLRQLGFQAGSQLPPPELVHGVDHHLEDHHVVDLNVVAVAPPAAGGSAREGGDAAEPFGELALESAEPVSRDRLPADADDRQEDLDAVQDQPAAAAARSSPSTRARSPSRNGF